MHLPKVTANEAHKEALKYGSQLKLETPIDQSQPEFAVVDDNDNLLALAKPKSPTTLQPSKVFTKTN